MGKPLKPLDDLGRELPEALEQELQERGALTAARQRFLLDNPQERQELLARMGQAVDEAHQAELQQRLDLARVRTRLLAKPERARASRKLVWAGALGAGAAAALLAVILLGPAQPLTFTIDEKAGQVGQWLSVAGAGAPAEMHFSDGSSLRLAPGTSSRVIDLSRRGARVGLEQGTLDVHVIPGGDKQWVLAVGPFTVQVVGTRFQVTWDQGDKHFRIKMGKGKVKVRGPTVGERELVRGETVDVWVEARRMVLLSGDEQPLASKTAAPADEQTRPGLEPGSQEPAPAKQSGAASAGKDQPDQPASAAAAAPAKEEPPASPGAPAVVATRAGPDRTATAPRARVAQSHPRPARPTAARASPPRPVEQTVAAKAAPPASRQAPAGDEAPAAKEPGAPRDEPPPSPAEEKPTQVAGPDPTEEKPAQVAGPDPGELARRGQYSQAMEAAASRGWDKILDSADASQLAALATAARSERDAGRAVKLLQSIRRRFPASAQAAGATFTLGTISVHQLKDHQAAAGWFSRYLEQWPAGALVREARGRQVESLHRAGKLPEACAAARRYRADHPAGPHIRYIRRVLVKCGPAAVEDRD